MVSINALVSTHGKLPLFYFGVISDVRYADIPNGRSFLGVPRYYRHSFSVLQRAIETWNNQQKRKLAINFGDIVDGLCPKDQSLNTVKKLVAEFDKFNGPVYHMIGNHCLYNLPGDKLLPLLKIESLAGHAYYDFLPSPGDRIIVLDGYDISAIGWPPDNPNTLQAVEFLRKNNSNLDSNSPGGLMDLERRFLMFNGAVGRKQMERLDNVLREATKLKEKVIVCCHLPLDPGVSCREPLLWSYDECDSMIALRLVYLGMIIKVGIQLILMEYTIDPLKHTRVPTRHRYIWIH